MNPQIKQRWIEALESGEYPKGSRCLRSIDDDGKPTGYCCMGVLEDIYAKEFHQTWIASTQEPHKSVRVEGYNHINYMNKDVADWAGLPVNIDGSYDGKLPNGDPNNTLAMVNDRSTTFDPVIYLIRKYL